MSKPMFQASRQGIENTQSRISRQNVQRHPDLVLELRDDGVRQLFVVDRTRLRVRYG